MPRFFMLKARRQGDRSMKVLVARSPAAVQLDVFAIDLPVWMNLHRAIVGVVAADDHSTAVAHHVERLRNRLGRAARLDDDIHAATTGDSPDLRQPLFRRYVER